MTKQLRFELACDQRLSPQARLLGVLLSDYADGLEPAEATHMIGMPASTVRRWAGELRARCWLTADGGRWRLTDEAATPLTSERDTAHIRAPDRSPVSATPLINERSPVSGGPRSAPRAHGLRSDLPSENSGSSKTNNKIQADSFVARASGQEEISEEKFPKKNSGNGVAKKRATKRWPADLDATADMRRIALERGIDFALEFDKLRDHEFKTAHSDWAAVGRNWMRNARPIRGSALNRAETTQKTIFDRAERIAAEEARRTS